MSQTLDDRPFTKTALSDIIQLLWKLDAFVWKSQSILMIFDTLICTSLKKKKEIQKSGEK